jgi:inward rectifier potassium channel
VLAVSTVETTREPQDLGFGSRVAQQTRTRFLNRDGTFNVAREGMPLRRSLNAYHALLTMSWVSFYAIVLGLYLLTNLFFAVLFFLCGPGAIQGLAAKTPSERFANDFFFSVQTLATIGYGRWSPEGSAANTVVTVEALVGVLGLTLVAGLAFARFSRPTAHILFSKNAVIAPYEGITAFEFRIVNERTNQLIEVAAKVILSRLEPERGKNARKFHLLRLERSSVVFFPLHWVIVHPIDKSSPLFGVTEKSLHDSDAEFLILLTGIDETFSQTVHARSSYKAHEVVMGAKFKDMFVVSEDGIAGVDIRLIHEIEAA